MDDDFSDIVELLAFSFSLFFGRLGLLIEGNDSTDTSSRLYPY